MTLMTQHLITCRMTPHEQEDLEAHIALLGLTQDAFMEEACAAFGRDLAQHFPCVPELLWEIQSGPSKGARIQAHLGEEVYTPLLMLHKSHGYRLADLFYTALKRAMCVHKRVHLVPLHVSSSLYREYRLRDEVHELERAIQWYMPHLRQATPQALDSRREEPVSLLRTYVTRETYKAMQGRDEEPHVLCERALHAYFEAHPRHAGLTDDEIRGVCRVELDEKTYTVMRQIMILKRMDRFSDFCVKATRWWLEQDSRHLRYYAAPLSEGLEQSTLRRMSVIVSSSLHQAVARCFKHDTQRVQVAYYNVLLHYIAHILETDAQMAWLKDNWSGQVT